MLQLDIIGSYRTGARSGLTTGVAAGGALSTFRWSDAGTLARLRAIEVAALVTTGFTAAQEVGYDIARGSTWSVAASAQTAMAAIKMKSGYVASKVAAADLRIAGTAAVTKGTVTEDTDILGADSMWALAATAGGTIGWQRFTFDQCEGGGLLLDASQGVLVRNTVAMGAAGVVRWFIFYQWDEVRVLAA